MYILIKVFEQGAVIEIEIIWSCNYDFNSKCKPIYSFKRYDTPFYEREASSGFNFRFLIKKKI